MSFDAGFELHKLEETAEPLFNDIQLRPIEKAESEAIVKNKLQAEVNSLSPEEMKAVGFASEHKFDRDKVSDSLNLPPFFIEPVIKMNNETARVTGFKFSSSYWQQDQKEITIKHK